MNIGIIAGAGVLPVESAKNAVSKGYSVFVVAFDGYTDKKIENYSTGIKYFKLGKFNAPIKFLKENNVDKVILIGNIPHVNVFKDLDFDLRSAKFVLKLRNKTPIAIFKAIEEEFKKDGIEIIDSTFFLKNWFADKGEMVGKISKEKKAEIDYGYKIAKSIADMDIGLSVALKDYDVIAVEAIEGTDECIKRANELVKKFKDIKYTFIKVSRTNQDFRFDLPVIGVNTVKLLHQGGADIIAVEAGKTLMVDKPEVIELCKKYKINLIGI